MAIVGVVAYTPQGIVNETDFFSTDMFFASYDQADVQIEVNAIEVIDSDTYHIVGSIDNSQVSWDLTYVRQADSWFGGDREMVGLFPWEQMSWLIYMPGAYVSGEIEVNGEIYYVDSAPGYHDHNWGEWIPSTTLWNWAQYFEPGLTLEMGDFMNKPAGTLGIEFQGKRIIFSKKEYRLIHTKWTFDSENRKHFPVKTWLYAENETTQLLLRMETYETEALQGEMPFPLPDIIIYEQTVYYVGQLWEKDPDGKWNLSVSFKGHGFKEYTARKLKRGNISQEANKNISQEANK
jgi:hypothetical protein